MRKQIPKTAGQELTEKYRPPRKKGRSWYHALLAGCLAAFLLSGGLLLHSRLRSGW